MFKGVKQKKVLLYQIWENYSNQATSLSYGEYMNNKKLHENRPFVNYMRSIINRF